MRNAFYINEVISNKAGKIYNRTVACANGGTVFFNSQAAAAKYAEEHTNQKRQTFEICQTELPVGAGFKA